jgi:hypothetical protein
MADLIFMPGEHNTEFGCYSERGLMSYFMLCVLPDQVGDFLADLRFPDGVEKPFENQRGQHPTSKILSELCFGNEGFGSPDGALYVECSDPTMFFIEVKLNESYAKSCRRRSYNSTIRGQLELKWRMTQLHKPEFHQFYKGKRYIKESPAFKTDYEERDDFYRASERQDEKKWRSWRRLKIDKGVEKFLKLLTKCDDRVFFCAITPDHQNPFDALPELRPRTAGVSWDQAKSKFCWLPVTQISVTGPVQCRDGAVTEHRKLPNRTSETESLLSSRVQVHENTPGSLPSN